MDVAEVEQHQGVMTHDDPHRWGKHFYDGALAYDQGATHLWNGALRFNGTALHNGFSATAEGARYEGDREEESP